MTLMRAPTIKGIFVLSHMRALEKERGLAALQELKRRYGKPLDIQSSDNIPIEEENEILGHIVDILSPVNLSDQERGYEAGRLHLKNFATTPMWSILSPAVRANPKWLLMQSRYISELVYDGVQFRSEDISPTTVRLVLDATGYPLEHFQGFLYELMAMSGLTGAVESDIQKDGSYAYTLKWT